MGPEYRLSDAAFAGLELEPTEKADLYVATRQYDRALDILTEALDQPVDFYKNPYEHERALRKYLAITIRVKKDPAAAIHTIDKFLKHQDLPYYLARNAQSWRKSLQDWLDESKTKQPSLAQAQRLIEKARRLQSTPNERAGDIEYLRA